jgi:proline iminopeptidase
VLLLHGGPGATHEYLEAFDSYFPGASIEYYYYDQLGSQLQRPARRSLAGRPAALRRGSRAGAQGAGPEQQEFLPAGPLLGRHPGAEYALKYGQNLKGLVISNMMMSIPAYNTYADTVLMPKMDQKALAEIRQLEADNKYEDPRYMELLIPNHYVHHILRMPADQWPEPVSARSAHESEDLRADAGPERTGRA